MKNQKTKKVDDLELDLARFGSVRRDFHQIVQFLKIYVGKNKKNYSELMSRNVLSCFKMRLIICIFETLQMLYPPKGASKAEPVWGAIVFTDVLILPSCVLETYFDVSKTRALSTFLKF